MHLKQFTFLPLFLICFIVHGQTAKPVGKNSISESVFLEKVKAGWYAQIIAVQMGFQFEHKQASVKFIDQLPEKFEFAPVDDDYLYEMISIRGFEKYGSDMTVEELGETWKENHVGTWGSSEQARLGLERGMKAPDTGHPKYNKFWFTIGPQFCAEIFGLLAPGMPNTAGKLARNYGHLNGYAEAVDGAVFVAGMVSLAFTEKDQKIIIKKAAKLIHPSSPYRQALDQMISLAEKGKSHREVCDALEKTWHPIYPVTNNAIPNGPLAAAGLWFGEGDFLKTINLVYQSGDFTDADCNAANAGTVVAVMKGMKGIPQHLVSPFNDRIKGDNLGGVKIEPAIDESISSLSEKTLKIAKEIIKRDAATINQNIISLPFQEIKTQEPELFSVSDLTKYWNPEWKLERAGLGAAKSSLGKVGSTFLIEDILVTYPQDEVRGTILRRKVKVADKSILSFTAGVDPNKEWRIEVMADHKTIYDKILKGDLPEREWEDIKIDLSQFANQEVEIRLYQILLLDGSKGMAYWKNLKIE
jgi:hypothetical protein